MGCDRYLELLSLRLDGVLTEAGERELEEHLTACPDCRAAGAQLAALRSAFDDWEEVPAPQGFAQGVMDRIRTEAGEKKIIPLFKQPRFRALAGLAACAALAVGLYGASVRQNQEEMMLTARSFQRDIYVEYPGSGVDDYAGVCSVDGAQETGDTPKIAAYAASGASEDGNGTYQKAAPGDGSSAVIRATPMVNTEVLTLDRMPEGAWELIPPETPSLRRACMSQWSCLRRSSSWLWSRGLPLPSPPAGRRRRSSSLWCWKNPNSAKPFVAVGGGRRRACRRRLTAQQHGNLALRTSFCERNVNPFKSTPIFFKLGVDFFAQSGYYLR